MSQQKYLLPVIFIFIAFFIISFASISQSNKQSFKTTKELLSHIKKTQDKKHLKAFTFVQETIVFNKEGVAQDTSTWYEAIRYPKDFRIDFGNTENGNANINRNDSIYVFRKNNLVHKGKEIQEFLIVEGGLFYYTIEETLDKLNNLGIDIEVFTKSKYKGNPIYIIGALENDYTKPQIWLDAKDFYVVRRFNKGKKGELFEVRYDDFKNINGYYIETWVEFYVDGKLIQTERYNDINTSPNISDDTFNPNTFGKVYWFNQ